MIEDDDLGGAIREFEELVTTRRDIDEGDECVIPFVLIDPVFMVSRDIVGIFAPGTPNGPRRTEAVRASCMVETNSLHVPRVLSVLAPGWPMSRKRLFLQEASWKGRHEKGAFEAAIEPDPARRDA
jgi:hypothetical protein